MIPNQVVTPRSALTPSPLPGVRARREWAEARLQEKSPSQCLAPIFGSKASQSSWEHLWLPLQSPPIPVTWGLSVDSVFLAVGKTQNKR